MRTFLALFFDLACIYALARLAATVHTALFTVCDAAVLSLLMSSPVDVLDTEAVYATSILVTVNSHVPSRIGWFIPTDAGWLFSRPPDYPEPSSR